MICLQPLSAVPALSDGCASFGREAFRDLPGLPAEAEDRAAAGLPGAAFSSEVGEGPGCGAQLAAFLRALSERVDLASFEILDFAARGAEVLSFGTFSGRLREGQRDVASDWAIHWRVESGRLRMSKAFGMPPALVA